MKRFIIGSMLITVLPACGGDPAAKDGPAKTAPDAASEAAPEAPLDPRVAKAVEIADAIAAAPQDADEILAKHGLDRAQLESMMFEIAHDPALSNSYRIARAD